MKNHNFWHYLSDGKMHHFQLVSENGELKYYVDGKLVQSISDTNNSKAKKS
jgi:hypothetical protein